MGEYYILKDKTPEPASLLEWAEQFQNLDARIVARDELDGIVVSTVFLGIDHGFGDGPPLLFETLIFGGEHDGEMDRYSTYGAAEAGHAAMVAKVKKGQ